MQKAFIAPILTSNPVQGLEAPCHAGPGAGLPRRVRGGARPALRSELGGLCQQFFMWTHGIPYVRPQAQGVFLPVSGTRLIWTKARDGRRGPASWQRSAGRSQQGPAMASRGCGCAHSSGFIHPVVDVWPQASWWTARAAGQGGSSSQRSQPFV